MPRANRAKTLGRPFGRRHMIVLVLVLATEIALWGWTVPSTPDPLPSGTPSSMGDLVASNDSSVPRELADPSPMFYQTHPSGNFSMHVRGPHRGTANASLGAGGELFVDYQFWVDHFNASIDDGLVVRVPQSLALFPATPSELTVTAPATVFTVNNASNWSAPFSQSSLELTEAATFSPSSTAIFTSQLVAVTTSLPWNSVNLTFQWNWTFVDPPLKPVSSGWVGSQNLTPDQYVQLASTSRLSMSNGSPFTACVSGSVEGRTFSLHAETVKGVSVNDFVQVNATVPRVTSLPFCWSALITLPNATLPPETLLVHVWDYQNAYTSNVTTLLLYSLSVKIVNATSTPSNDILGYPVSTWLTFTSIGAAALAVALIVYGVFRARRRREIARQTEPPDSSVAPSAGAASGSPVDFTDGRPGRRNQ